MSQYRRYRVNGATYFFTVNLAQRHSQLLVQNVGILREAYRKMVLESPLQVDAFVVLPDHIHAIWTLPQGDHDYSSRWRKFKARFSHAVPTQPRTSFSKQRKRERGIWQRRFWEHMIRDEDEFAALMTYCQENPVKHGFVADARDWPYSSFNRRA